MTRNRLGVAVFIIGVAVCGVWAFSNMQFLVGFSETGSGGLGYVSGGYFAIDDLQVIGAPLIAFVLSVLARKRGGFARSLRRAHIIATVTVVLILVLLITFVISGRAPRLEPTVFLALMFCSALWVPLQGFFASGFLALLIQKRTS
ncbi:MAG TPA: hypothetical protein VGF24_32995 [Vicinamibacterales bacterium]|jgi:hypothetical protein